MQRVKEGGRQSPAAPLAVQLPANCPKKAAEDNPSLPGSLPLRWDTWIQLLPPWFGLIQTLAIAAFGE